VLRDDPSEATWLAADQRTAPEDSLAQEKRGRPKKDPLDALKDVKVLILTGILFSYWIGINGIAIWMPLILKGHGLSDVAVGWLSAVPYLVGAGAMMAWARQMERTGHLAAASSSRQQGSGSP
jgi:MFS transporter, ACS family, tartrate transporter